MYTGADLSMRLLTLEQRSEGWTVMVDGWGIKLCRHGQAYLLFRDDALNCPDCLRYLIGVEIERQMGIVG